MLEVWLKTPTESGCEEQSATAPNSPEHEHHSLSQLLALGLIEQSVGFVFAKPTFAPAAGFLPPPVEFRSELELDLQTAGRAPPSLLF